MLLRAGWIGVWLVVGCAKPVAPAVSATVSPADAVAGVPALDHGWSVAEYGLAARALLEAGASDPAGLPRREGPRAAYFARLTSLEGLDRAFTQAATPEVVLDSMEHFGRLAKHYLELAVRDASLQVESVQLNAAQIRFSSHLVPSLVRETGLDEASLREEPVRLHGLARMRYGLVTQLEGMLTMGPEFVPRETLRAATTVVDDVTPYLLDEEAERLLQLLTLYEASDTDAEDREDMRTALQDRPDAHWTVAAFEDHHRSESAKIRASLQQSQIGRPDPIEHADGRFSHPNGAASARFAVRPSALTQVRASDGPTLLVHAVSATVDEGMETSIICFAPLVVDPVEWAELTLHKMSPAEPAPTQLDGFDALEVEFVQEGAQARVVAVPLDQEACLVLTAYPLDLPDGAAAAAAFHASVDILRD